MPTISIWKIWFNPFALGDWALNYCLKVKYDPELLRFIRKSDREFYLR